ncbi:MAG TPA: glycosyltransferase [Drouetiella sp.]|jgi:dolichyl-phosphate beta-glucosyltransferase
MSESTDLTIVFPAYQEEKRIGLTMETWGKYLDAHYPGSEVIVVTDGCRDKTAEVARQSFESNSSSCRLNLIELSENMGKGNAVKVGMLAAQGKIIVFTDSDLSYDPQLLNQFLKQINEGADLAIAQREKKTQYPGIGRRLLATASRALVGNFVVPGIRDTQAGFKVFTREAAQKLFERAKTKRFLFDLELLVIAREHNCKIAKVYVDWTDREGSTVRIIFDTMRSARDLMLIYWRKLIGAYKP